jgi:hypothetical protein
MKTTTKDPSSSKKLVLTVRTGLKAGSDPTMAMVQNIKQ